MERGVVCSEYQIGGISMRTEDSLEQSLRRVLKAAGYMMRKSHAPISADNLGGYMIVDMSRNTVAAGGRFELTWKMSGSGHGICADRGCG